MKHKKISSIPAARGSLSSIGLPTVSAVTAITLTTMSIVVAASLIVVGCRRSSPQSESPDSAQTAPLRALAWGEPLGSETDAEGRPLRMKDRSTGIEMILCPRGTFVMGSPTDEFFRGNDEIERTVEVEAFYLAAHETTQSEWQMIMGANPSHFQPRHPTPTGADILSLVDQAIATKNLRDGLSFESFVFQGGGTFPVERVSWDDIAGTEGFLARSRISEPESSAERLRLPTEAEWEYACRAGTKSAYASGRSIGAKDANIDAPIMACCYRNMASRERTVPVGRFKPNAWGFCDMHGNVWEWCADTSTTDERIIRGGSWVSLDFDCRSANREFKASSTREGNIGFRVARSAGVIGRAR